MGDCQGGLLMDKDGYGWVGQVIGMIGTSWMGQSMRCAQLGLAKVCSILGSFKLSHEISMICPTSLQPFSRRLTILLSRQPYSNSQFSNLSNKRIFSSSWKELESYLISEKSLRLDGSFYQPDRIWELCETMRDMDLSKKLLLLFVEDFEDLELMLLSCSFGFFRGVSSWYSLEVWIDFSFGFIDFWETSWILETDISPTLSLLMNLELLLSCFLMTCSTFCLVLFLEVTETS